MGLPKILFCPECQEARQKSEVRYMGSSSTALGYRGVHWDEDGQLHDHNPNTTRHMFRCSNDHSFMKTEKKSCPNELCNWGKE